MHHSITTNLNQFITLLLFSNGCTSFIIVPAAWISPSLFARQIGLSRVEKRCFDYSMYRFFQSEGYVIGCYYLLVRIVISLVYLFFHQDSYACDCNPVTYL
jgi:hypothetical protein